MKILFVSNMFPPHHVGGYEIRCAQVGRALVARGDELRVVTSEIVLNENATSADSELHPFPVDRVLGHYGLEAPRGKPHTLVLARRQLEDVRWFSAILDDFEPDVVAWWNMEGLAKPLLALPSARSIPAVCFVDDCWMVTEFGKSGECDAFHWFDFWRGEWGPKPLRPLIRRAVGWWERRLRGDGIPTRPFPLDPCDVCFVSDFLRWEHQIAGLELPSTRVIYGGVPVAKFYGKRESSEFAVEPLGILYVGYLSRNRGLQTLIEAIGRLTIEEQKRVRLSIAYGGPVHETTFSRSLKDRIDELGLSKRVRFMPRVPHKEMPALYRSHQLLIVPSTRGEGLPMTMMEAAASGAAVITTGSGGSIELADRAGMPLFPQDHPVALSRLLRSLLKDRATLAAIAERGQRVVMKSFTFDRMVDEIRDSLLVQADQMNRHRLEFGMRSGRVT